MVDVNQLFVGHVGRMNRQLLGNDETGSPLGPLSPVIHLAFTGQVFLSQVGQVRLEGDTVLHLHLADLQGRKQILKHHDENSRLMFIEQACDDLTRQPGS